LDRRRSNPGGTRSLDQNRQALRDSITGGDAIVSAPTRPAPEPPLRALRRRPPGARPSGSIKVVLFGGLLHGHAWANVDTRLSFDCFKTIRPRIPRRGGSLGRMGHSTSATGNPTDAAVCWINAIWEMDSTPAIWLEQWLLANAGPRNSPGAISLDRLLSEPGRFGAGGRAAYAAWPAINRCYVGVGGRSQDDRLPRSHFDDLPVRPLVAR